jgi:lantibiotic modifying enzyme
VSLELLERLCADWQEICSLFTPERAPGVLIKVQGGVGDTHCGGRSVILLTFDSGFQLIYKPKSLSIDVHFQELLTWLNAHGTHPPLRILKMISGLAGCENKTRAASSCPGSLAQRR